MLVYVLHRETIGSLIVVPAYEWLHVVRREETKRAWGTCGR
jgi:hypothetical protein